MIRTLRCAVGSHREERPQRSDLRSLTQRPWRLTCQCGIRSHRRFTPQPVAQKLPGDIEALLSTPAQPHVGRPDDLYICDVRPPFWGPRPSSPPSTPFAADGMQPPRPRLSCYRGTLATLNGLHTPPGPDPAAKWAGLVARTKISLFRPYQKLTFAYFCPLAGRGFDFPRATLAPDTRCCGRQSWSRACIKRDKQQIWLPVSPGQNKLF